MAGRVGPARSQLQVDSCDLLSISSDSDIGIDIPNGFQSKLNHLDSEEFATSPLPRFLTSSFTGRAHLRVESPVVSPLGLIRSLPQGYTMTNEMRPVSPSASAPATAAAAVKKAYVRSKSAQPDLPPFSTVPAEIARAALVCRARSEPPISFSPTAYPRFHVSPFVEVLPTARALSFDPSALLQSQQAHHGGRATPTVMSSANSDGWSDDEPVVDDATAPVGGSVGGFALHEIEPDDRAFGPAVTERQDGADSKASAQISSQALAAAEDASKFQALKKTIESLQASSEQQSWRDHAHLSSLEQAVARLLKETHFTTGMLPDTYQFPDPDTLRDPYAVLCALLEIHTISLSCKTDTTRVTEAHNPVPPELRALQKEARARRRAIARLEEERAALCQRHFPNPGSAQLPGPVEQRLLLYEYDMLQRQRHLSDESEITALRSENQHLRATLAGAQCVPTPAAACVGKLDLSPNPDDGFRSATRPPVPSRVLPADDALATPPARAASRGALDRSRERARTESSMCVAAPLYVPTPRVSPLHAARDGDDAHPCIPSPLPRYLSNSSLPSAVVSFAALPPVLAEDAPDAGDVGPVSRPVPVPVAPSAEAALCGPSPEQPIATRTKTPRFSVFTDSTPTTASNPPQNAKDGRPRGLRVRSDSAVATTAKATAKASNANIPPPGAAASKPASNSALFAPAPCSFTLRKSVSLPEGTPGVHRMDAAPAVATEKENARPGFGASMRNSVRGARPPPAAAAGVRPLMLMR